MIELMNSEVKVITEQTKEYSYGWSLEDRIEHIHQMTRDGYSLKNVWSSDRGYHASFFNTVTQYQL